MKLSAIFGGFRGLNYSSYQELLKCMDTQMHVHAKFYKKLCNFIYFVCKTCNFFTFECETCKTGTFSYLWNDLTMIFKILYVFIANKWVKIGPKYKYVLL